MFLPNLRTPHCLLVQFDTTLWADLLELSTFAPVRWLLRRASLGLGATGTTRGKVEGLMRQLAAAAYAPYKTKEIRKP